jgi:prophage regulatory protein
VILPEVTMPKTRSTQARSASLVLRRRDVTALIGVSDATIVRLVARREFPAPRKLGERSVGWLRTEVETWVAARPISDIPSPQRPTASAGAC